MERKGREQQQPPKRCPRCESTNTKFCYYNNYSQSQPRHYCKACRRYWTEGGTLRNVPQSGGAGSRRGSKRQKKTGGSSTPTAAACAAVTPMPTGPANRSAITTMSAGPEEALPLPPPPSAPFFFMGGGIGEGLMGLQSGNECHRFHPGADIVAELGEQSAMIPLLLSSPPPGFINFPVPQHQQLQPQNLLPSNMMIHPTPPMPSVAAFTAAASAEPSASGAAAAGYDGEEGFWNVFGNGGGSSGVPPPPTSSGPF